MVPRVAGGKGTGKSFSGAAAYLLHDKAVDGQQQTSDERVAWTEVRNVGVDDPELASRVMAATAMDSDRLKREHHEAQQAELPEDERTPYKSSKPSFNHVFHYSLAWHPDEAPGLTRAEQSKAADASLRALGADHLQSVIIAHNDEAHPHVHVLVNRVNPETGAVEKIDSHAKAKLRDWALEYERDRGHIYCPERELRAIAREQGQVYEHDAKQHRGQREAEAVARDEIIDNPHRAQAVRDAQREKDVALGRETSEMRARHTAEWDKLSKDHAFRKAMINQEAETNQRQAEKDIGRDFAPKWRELQEAQTAEREAFTANEESLRGKLGNVAGAIGNVWKSRAEGEGVGGAIKDTFRVMGGEGAREQAMLRAQERARKELSGEQDEAKRLAFRDIEATRSGQIDDNFKTYQTTRDDMKAAHVQDQQDNREAWAQRDADRREAWQSFAQSERLERDYTAAAKNEIEPEAEASTGDEAPKRSKEPEAVRVVDRNTDTTTTEFVQSTTQTEVEKALSTPAESPTQAQDSFREASDPGPAPDDDRR
ncbi:MAG: relaxase/mobilization nuclease domain-containing protein [Pseudomonadota bacterium]